jgi:hypothetical protein
MYGEAGVPDAEDAQLRHETTGEWLDGGAVAHPGLARTVRVRDGVAATTAGPYGDTGALTGFWLLDCEDADRAVEIAARLPAARAAAVEVRPLMAPSGMEM